MVYAQRLLVVFIESKISCGKEGINLPVHAYHSNSHFIFFLVIFFLSLSLVSFSIPWFFFSNSYFLVKVSVFLPPFCSRQDPLL